MILAHTAWGLSPLYGQTWGDQKAVLGQPQGNVLSWWFYQTTVGA